MSATAATDARHVLAQAMGRAPPPVLPTVAEEFGIPLLEEFAAKPSVDTAIAALSDVRVWRSVALLALLMLVPWLAHLLYRARQRFVGSHRAAIPIDYKQVRKIARGSEQL